MYLKKAQILTQVANAADNGSGLIRITTSTPHGRTTSDVVYIADVVGVTAANGRWVITVIDGSTFDLQGSTFAGAYTSGGFVALRQELRVKLTTTPTTPVQVAVDVRYLNTLTGSIAGTDTIFASLPTDASVTVLVSDYNFDIVVDSCNIFNADNATRIVEVTRANHVSTARQARASLLTLERVDVSRGRATIYSATGRMLQEAL